VADFSPPLPFDVISDVIPPEPVMSQNRPSCAVFRNFCGMGVPAVTLGKQRNDLGKTKILMIEMVDKSKRPNGATQGPGPRAPLVLFLSTCLTERDVAEKKKDMLIFQSGGVD
jgi:hypothetical protein